MLPTEKLYIATIANDAEETLRRFGAGVELDQFCMASNMDMPDFPQWDRAARAHLAAAGGDGHILHAPFAELSPAAIDPMALEVVRTRMQQAYLLAKRYGIRRMVVHAGYIPHVYMPEWFTERSIAFWKDFLADKPPDFQLLIENVLEDDPGLLAAVLEGVDDARAMACLDIGHAFCMSMTPLSAWIDRLGARIGHVHLHNNDGTRDAHAPWNEGGIDFAATIARLRQVSPEATFTIEMRQAAPSVEAVLSPAKSHEAIPPPMPELYPEPEPEPEPEAAPDLTGAREVLRRVFGYDAYRDGQREAIDAAMAGRDVLGIMPTGAGKSLCFQVPALLRGGVTLVISPLISLMKDQVAALGQAGVASAYLNSSLTEGQFARALQNAIAGQYRIIYVAPERLLTARFLAFAQGADITGIAVDEAHCISQWGQDFRPSYLDIPRFIDSLPRRPSLSAFTATATPSVRGDIVRLLALRSPVIVQTGFDRPNLHYEVQRPKKKNEAVLALVRKHKGQSGIIYCATRKNVEAVCALLQAKGFPATRYHAGLADQERQRNQDAFIYDEAPIIVATNAFGMGIDKSNVRYIIHYNMPKDLESYYQEAGRAGRDGERADCVLLFSPQDVQTQRYMIENNEDDEGIDPQTRRETTQKALGRLDQMTQYCRTGACLRDTILRYFGETTDGKPCGNCGSCLSTDARIDATQAALAILRGIKQTGQRFGLGTVLDMLYGARSKRQLNLGLDRHPYHGTLSALPREYLQALGEQLIAEGYLEVIMSDKFATVRLTTFGQDTLQGNRSVALKLPSIVSIAHAPANGKIDPVLFERLRATRQALARKQRIPAYMVVSDATLHDLCDRCPETTNGLLAVKGIGEHKAFLYGDAFLKTIREYQHDITTKEE